jgi:outer membrane lipoprotein-sorting protein
MLTLAVAYPAASFQAAIQEKPAPPAPVATAPAATAPAATAPAATQEKLPAAAEVLERYAAAVGGKALERLTSRVSKGSIEVVTFGSSGTFEQYIKAPDRVINISSFPGFGDVIQAVNGQAGWASMPDSGMRDLAGSELELMRRGAELNRALHLKEQYATLAVTAKTKVGGRDAYVLQATPAAGPAETWYFDVETGLLVKVELGSESGGTAFTMYLEDYKEVDGVKVPFTLRQETPSFQVNIRMTEVTHNVPIEDSRFAKPAQ